MNGNTYTLVHKDIRANIRIEILTSEYLTDIDAFTTKYASEFGLWEALEEKNFVISNENFTIEHRRGKRVYELPVVYSDQEKLKKFSQNNQGQANIKCDVEQGFFILSLIKKIDEDPELASFLLRNKYITERAYDDLTRFNIYRTRDVEESQYTYVSLVRYFINYSHVRRAAVGLKAYEEKDMMLEETTVQTKPKVLTKKKAPVPEQLLLFDPDKL